MTDLENQVLKIIGTGKKHLDEIFGESDHALVNVLIILQQLERNSLVQRLPGGYWKLRIEKEPRNEQ